MEIIEEIQLDYDDVLILPKASDIKSRADVNLERTFKFNNNMSWTGIPIIISNMSTVGTFEVYYEAQKYHILTCIHKHYSTEEWKNEIDKPEFNPEFIIPSVGVCENELANLLNIFRYAHLKCKDLKWLCLDIANGYSNIIIDTIRVLQEHPLFKNIILIAGNIVDRNRTRDLFQAGVQITKNGIGSSRLCLSRVVAGVGCPQLSTNLACQNVAKEYDGFTIADGGCKTSADIVKGLASSDGFVMIGSMLAGHEENTSSENKIIKTSLTGNVIWNSEGKFVSEAIDVKFAKVYGMSSNTAMNQYNGGTKNYRTSEGRTALIPFKGEIKNTIEEILGGIRSAMTYIGCQNIEELYDKTIFIKVNKTHEREFEQYTTGS